MRRYYEPTIAALAETGTAFEINTAGLRKECVELYPADEFLVLAKNADIPLLINSDAHAPGELAAGYSEAVAAAKSAGFAETSRFANRKRTSVKLP